MCAYAIATLEGIDREAVDQLAFTSQQRAAVAIEEGRFDKSLVPVHNLDGTLALDKEEFPRPSTTMETLGGLKTVFNMYMDIPVDDQGTTYGNLVTGKYDELEGKMNHVHHAGNSSGVVDGAAALLLASKEYADKNGLKPRARIVATANMGDCPTLMLNAPVPAARKVLEKAGLTTDDVDWIVPHQANKRILEGMSKRLKVPMDRVVMTVNNHGNTSAASIPLAMAVAAQDKRIKQGDIVVTGAIGGGLAWGTAVIRW